MTHPVHGHLPLVAHREGTDDRHDLWGGGPTEAQGLRACRNVGYEGLEVLPVRMYSRGGEYVGM